MSEIIGVKLHTEVIIPAIGVCPAGTLLSRDQCADSWLWLLDGRNNVAIPCTAEDMERHVQVAEAMAAAKAEAPLESSEVVAPESDSEVIEGESATEVVEPSGDTPVTEDASGEPGSEVPENEMVAKLTEILTEGKKRMDVLMTATGFGEDVLTAVLTEANGFSKNQQGWWGIAKV